MVAETRNSSVAVSKATIANFAGAFDWLKNVIEANNPSILNHLAFRQNEKGFYNAQTLIALLSCFNTNQYPVDDSEHPIRTFLRRGQVLSGYLKSPNLDEKFAHLTPIMFEIFQLYDLITSSAWRLYCARNINGDPIRPLFERGRAGFYFPFLHLESDHRLHRAAAMPIFAAFRSLTEARQDQMVYWTMPFDEIKGLWTKHANSFLSSSLRTWQEGAKKNDRFSLSKYGGDPDLWQLMLINLSAAMNPDSTVAA